MRSLMKCMHDEIIDEMHANVSIKIIQFSLACNLCLHLLSHRSSSNWRILAFFFLLALGFSPALTLFESAGTSEISLVKYMTVTCHST